MCSNAYGSSGNYLKDFISNFANYDTKNYKLLEAVIADSKTVLSHFLCRAGRSMS